MKIIFSIAWVVFSFIFTIISLINLDFLSNAGRPGPGFFPTIIGLALLILSIFNLMKDVKDKHKNTAAMSEKAEDDKGKRYVKDMAWVIVFIIAFIAALTTLGGIVSMVLFTFGILLYLNRGKVVQNVIISVIFPTCLFLLFEVWLHAGIPEGIFGF
ncbi:tripartite tricarboxylate transporter TctB family protein [Lentibacillus sp. N15]|uniref:tripartite tricarboxylate transporter TctB family protein n=1 Tax=Lentibacillus songyuanensis TaxID=3136161 RepID=UPI0031BA62ED